MVKEIAKTLAGALYRDGRGTVALCGAYGRGMTALCGEMLCAMLVVAGDRRVEKA